ncbi:uncharacterized protein LOC144104550 [Amblyomma americanum]
MERVEQFGDPWFLLLAEDYIVLKLETPWPVDVPLPDGYSMGDDDGHLLVTNQASLVSATNSLRETRISEALFAGCAAFESSNVFEASAREVLRFAGEICIVHNRDTIYKLIRMFPNAKVLALPHDLCFHAVDLDEPYRCRGEPLVPTSELRVLEGSTRIGCASSLLLTEDTVLEIVRTCPKVRRIDAASVLGAFLQLAKLSPRGGRHNASNFTHLMLGFAAKISNSGHVLTAEAEDVKLAAGKFPFLEVLKVIVGSRPAFAAISAFHYLRSLSVSLAAVIRFADVGAELQRLLKTWPRLESLSLWCCGGLRLASLAQLCPELKTLRLVSCEISSDDTPLDYDAFPKLRTVELCVKLLRVVFDAFLYATSGTLRNLRLAGDASCRGFLHLCCLHYEPISFPCLEELTLGTALTIDALQVMPQDLHKLLTSLPALRHLSTDSYDLRLFFENYCVPRGSVSLSWCECVYCCVHRPCDESSDEEAAVIRDCLGLPM